ncbi:hypothetical protein MTO96_024009 [Rhipicephalus appendiculatus]
MFAFLTMRSSGFALLLVAICACRTVSAFPDKICLPPSMQKPHVCAMLAMLPSCSSDSDCANNLCCKANCASYCAINKPKPK